MDSLDTTPISLDVRLEFSRAAVEVIARRARIRLLHIKGGTLDGALRPGKRSGTDVDVLVDPRRVPELHARMTENGWRVYSSFLDGSPFGHAQTYHHREWGYLDLHRRFPGVGIADQDAFEVLWQGRGCHFAAGVECSVSSVDAQAVLFVLNAARDLDMLGAEARELWARQADDERVRRSRLVRRLRAEVAFAAALGDLERYRRRREYLLWKTVSQGGSRTAEWWGRIKAAPTVSAALGTVARAPRVNRAVLAHELGHEPRTRDVIVAFRRRIGTALRESFGRGERKR
ncbi:nucleotidyltransferase family protein [Microbacterium aurantiacum]|uniref:nucleotidyltransferase family protein n=1 Tax=Microbacterium aurantiacum TaxID=162393 RepID=UPI000C7FD1A5|nr:nucleotidyltransferase family protein [Microbacterium aurantiacum]